MASSIPRPRPSLTSTQSMSPVMKVPLGSRVVLSKRRNGTIKYVGKLVNESGEWYGVALDEPKGDSDGMRGKDRYFYCPANHGVFVRRKEIYCTKEPSTLLKGPPSPVTDESSSCSSNISTDQQGDPYGQSTTGIVHPYPINTDNGSSSPLLKNFRGFRKQLDFISLRTVGPGRSREASPVSSSPSSPTARSALKPPSPLRRFSSFSQGLPVPTSPGSPTSKTVADDKRRQSSISLSSKPSPVRRTSSCKTSFSNSNEDFIQPVETTSPNRFSSLQNLQTSYVSMEDDDTRTSTIAEQEEPTITPEVDVSVNEMQPADDEDTGSTAPNSPVHDEDGDVATEIEAQASPSEKDTILASLVEVTASLDAEPPVDDALVSHEHAPLIADLASFSSGSEAIEALSTDKSLKPVATTAFHVPPIDTSAISGGYSPATSPRDSPTTFHRLFSNHNSPNELKINGEGSPQIAAERTPSLLLLGRSNSFRVSGTSLDGSPSSSTENLPSRRSNGFAVMSIDIIDNHDVKGEKSPTDTVLPSLPDDISDTSVASVPDPQLPIAQDQSPRSRQELTAVESISPEKSGPEERPLFFRRTNVGRSPMERRSSCSSFSASSSPPKSPSFTNTTTATSRSRVAELEKEISAMRSSHENIVAVLRATNKQHAGNVLELRAQVAALTEGNLWLERQLTIKSELVRELRDMEKQQQRDSVSVGEVEKILEIKDVQIQTLEREMAQLRQRLQRLEADKESQLYQQYQHFEARRDRDEKRIKELRKEVLGMITSRLELQSEIKDLKEMSLRFF